MTAFAVLCEAATAKLVRNSTSNSPALLSATQRGRSLKKVGESNQIKSNKFDAGSQIIRNEHRYMLLLAVTQEI